MNIFICTCITICFKDVILALWSQPMNAQYGYHIKNSRGGVGEREENVRKTTNDYPADSSNLPLPDTNNDNIIVNLSQIPNRTYNKNSRDSFGYTDALAEYHLLSREKEWQNKNPKENETVDFENCSTTTTFVTLNVDFTTTQPATSWKTPISNSFEARLFDIISTRAEHENFVYSPVSLQTLLAFIFTVSDGKLYEELAQLLAISNSRPYVAKHFENILLKSSIDEQSTRLIMANKFYYDYRYGPIEQSVRYAAKKSFDSELEQVNFFESKNAAHSINSWVRNKTHNLIKEIVTSSSLAGETSALLLSSIYFKSDWLTKFNPQDTEKQEFFLSRQTKLSVDMMYSEDVFRYGDFFEDLHASVLELPYKTSNLSMLLILPLDIEGLSNLERKLRYYDFSAMSQKLKREIVTIKLPKFQIEYEMDMRAALQELGLYTLFNNAGVINLFKNPQKPLKIDKFKHKSFINVNEAGTEAAATTVAKYVPLSLPIDMKYFVADHPFVFVIRNTNTTFFVGHVVKF